MNLQDNLIPNRKVIEHNDLISSVAKMDRVPLKMFELAVSHINIDQPPKDNIVYLSKKELFNFFDVKDNDKHSRFKRAIEKMQKQAYFEIREEKNKGFSFQSIVPIPYIEWNDYNDKVTVEFNHRIMPYLIELKNNFTQYQISELIDLNSKYSIVLYKWLSMFYNQYEYYKNKGNRNKGQLLKYKNPEITLKDLRILTDTIHEYPRFDNFETWILKKPINEINKNTTINVTYEKIRSGRSISSIKFHIEKNSINTNEFYKEEQQDETYLMSKHERELENQQDYFVGMQSVYTQLLLERFFIGYKDVTDAELIIGLQKGVYPLYEQLQNLKGFESVVNHLNYVKNHMEGYSSPNIVKYLKKSIEQYLLSLNK